MTVDFALFLSPEGIALAHRQPAGHWAFIGETRLDVADLDAALADLRTLGVERGGDGFETLLVLPDDQILYTSLMAPTDNPDLTHERIEEGLEGLTPYDVSDLIYDHRVIEEDRVKLAVIARETLGEAKDFAEGHGFKSVGFAAMPPLERFPGLPVFRDGAAPDLGLPTEGLVFGTDRWGMPAEPIAPPEPEPEPEPQPGPEPEPAPEPEAPQHPEPTDETAAPQRPLADMPEEATPNTSDDVGAGAPDVPDKVPEADATGPEDPASPPIASAELHDDGLHPAVADAPTTPMDDTQQDADATPDTLPTDPAPEIKADPPAPSAPTAPKPGKATKPAGAGRAIRANKDAPSQQDGARKRRFTPVVPQASDEMPAPTPNATAPDTRQPTTDGSAGTFTARRGKASAPPEDAGRLVGNRSSRLGFGAIPTGRSGPVLHPDAEPLPQDPAPAPQQSRLASQLSRVRDASKSRPKSPLVPEPAPRAAIPAGAETAGQGMAADTPAAASTAFPDPAPAPAKKPGGGLGARLPGLLGGRKARDKAQATPAATSAVSASDASLTTGLLARKPTEPVGGSFKTGLILTVILLILLAGIAIWSVLFLPNSPVARFFAPDDGVIEGDVPFDTVTPPDTAALPDPDTALPDTDSGTETVADGPTVPDTDPEALAALEDPAIPPVDVVAEEVVLPDIDAELDLEPLPPLPEDLLPSLEETQQIYAEDGVWPRTPDRPALGPLDSLASVYIASIDPAIPGLDAIALPPAGVDLNEQLRRIPSPPPFGSEFAVNERGLIDPTPDGVLTPEGAFVIAGAPPVAAVQRPIGAAPAAATEVAPVTQVEDAILGTFRPTQRPDDLSELRERQLLGGLSVTELADLRPTARPVSAQEAAAQASLFPGDGDGDGTADAAATTQATESNGTALAVAASIPPRVRPANIAAIVAAAERAPAAEAVPAAAVAPQPQIPSNASVARAATETNAIRLRNVNLIGVTGTPSNRRALVRLPSGRFVRVGVGDRLDGGRVAAIGEATLQYVRRGRNITLEIPG